MLSNYTTIAQAIERWLNRENVTHISQNVETFVQLAQNRINAKLAPPENLSVTTLSVDAESEDLPADFIELKQAWLDSGNGYDAPLEITTMDQVLKYSQSGNPCQIAVSGDKLWFGPVPSEATNVRIHYLSRPTDISTTNATNYWSNNAPELILYGALIEAFLFLKDDNRASFWEGKFSDAEMRIYNKNWRSGHAQGRVRDTNHNLSNWAP